MIFVDLGNKDLMKAKVICISYEIFYMLFIEKFPNYVLGKKNMEISLVISILHDTDTAYTSFAECRCREFFPFFTLNVRKGTCLLVFSAFFELEHFFNCKSD